jgi:hypothetical protein
MYDTMKAKDLYCIVGLPHTSAYSSNRNNKGTENEADNYTESEYNLL